MHAHARTGALDGDARDARQPVVKAVPQAAAEPALGRAEHEQVAVAPAIPHVLVPAGPGQSEYELAK